MSAVLLARIQFALTIGFHFIFPPLTIGMSWLLFIMMNMYKRTGKAIYRTMTRFWLKLFAISFAIGVATGIVMEFQFGMNWSEYSRFVGDIFGAPLAAEALLAFFLESTFMGVMLFGWNRLSTRVMWFASLMVAVGSTLSAFWIIVANSWMQTPAGYHLNNGRAELTNFFHAVFNPSTLPRYLHTVDAAIMTGAFFMVGISAWFMLHKQHQEFTRRSMKLSLLVALLSTVLALPLGHLQAITVAKHQPEKLAAMEGLFESGPRAPLLVFGIPNPTAKKVHLAITLPGALSWIAFGDAEHYVKGLDAYPQSEWPPIFLTFFPFHIMVGLWSYLLALTLVGGTLYLLKRLESSAWFLNLALFSIPLPFIANELGWITAEVGRQPWIVYRLMKTRDAVSISVPAYQILFSIMVFTIVYTLLFALWIHLLRKKVRTGPEYGPDQKELEVKA